MNIHIEQPASGGLPAFIAPLAHADAPWAIRASGNPLLDGWSLPQTDCKRIVCWSGSLADDLFDSHPLTWLAPGHNALAKFCDDTASQLCAQSRRICFQPHARHVLSDPPSVFSFLANREGQPFDALLSPAEMLEPSMLDTLDDHLIRMFEALGGRAAAVVLHDVAVSDDGESCIARPLGEGLLPVALVRQLIADNCPAEMPIVLMRENVESQCHWFE